MNEFYAFLIGVLVTATFLFCNNSGKSKSAREQELEEEVKRLKFQKEFMRGYREARPEFLEKEICRLKNDLASAKNALQVEKRQKEQILDTLYLGCIEIRILELALSKEAYKLIHTYAGNGQTYESVLAEIINFSITQISDELILKHLAEEYGQPRSSIISVQTVEGSVVKNKPSIKMTIEEFRSYTPSSPGEHVVHILDHDGNIISTKVITIFSH